MRQHNLGNVISFELVRTMKKRRFWLGIFAIPLLIVIVFTLVSVSSNHSKKTTDNQKNARFSFEYTDQSGLVDPSIVSKLKGDAVASENVGITDVKAGKVDAYFYYPAHPAKDAIKVFGKEKGVFENGKYSSVAQMILQTSVEGKIASADINAISRGGVKSTTVTFRNGKAAGGVNSLIPAMFFLVLFYMLIVLLGNQMLTSTLDEKENRVTEMILTTINPTNLILGKVISLFVLGIVQMVVFAIPIVTGYVFFKKDLNLPNIDFSHLVFDPQQMIVGALLLICGFALFTGSLVALGAAMPTAKDAGPIFGSLIALMFIPFYVFSLIASSPNAPVVQIFSYFPYTAPITGMLRNGLGTLPLWQAAIIIGELLLLSGLVLRLAVRLFRYGSIEYSRKLSLREIISA